MGLEGVRLLDEDGNPYSLNNPLPIEASITSNLNVATITALRPMLISASNATNTAVNPIYVGISTNTSSGGAAVNVSTFTAQTPGLVNVNTFTAAGIANVIDVGFGTGITSSSITLNTVTVATIPSANYASRKSMVIYNAGAATTTNKVYIGGNGVLTTTGFLLQAAERLILDASGSLSVMAIADLTGTTLNILEVG